jgi:hypothetical protein
MVAAASSSPSPANSSSQDQNFFPTNNSTVSSSNNTAANSATSIQILTNGAAATTITTTAASHFTTSAGNLLTTSSTININNQKLVLNSLKTINIASTRNLPITLSLLSQQSAGATITNTTENKVSAEFLYFFSSNFEREKKNLFIYINMRASGG